MGKVIYVTGAPATGKSTLCMTLASPGSGIDAFCYNERLRDYVRGRTGAYLDEADIRQQSAQIITSKHVQEVDSLLLREVTQARSSDRHLLIDSHPVTKELYGFRVTPFSAEILRDLEIDTFICLYATPNVLAKRIRDNAEGRPLPSEFDLSIHVQLQASVAAQYSVLTGRTCHLVDSDITLIDLVQQVRSLANLDQ